MKPGPKAKPISIRLEAKSIPITECGCQIWMGCIKPNNGYGQIVVNHKLELTHRVAWSQVNGPIPAHLRVLHRCDIPACINPNHLFLGTQADNITDMVRKNRGSRGSKHPVAKLTEEKILQIRSSKLSGRELSKKYGVSEGGISMIKSNKTWKHV